MHYPKQFICCMHNEVGTCAEILTTLVPSTRIRIHLNPQTFLCGCTFLHTYPVNPTTESAKFLNPLSRVETFEYNMNPISCARQIRSNPWTFESDDATKTVPVFTTWTCNMEAKTNAIASLFVGLISRLTAYFLLELSIFSLHLKLRKDDSTFLYLPTITPWAWLSRLRSKTSMSRLITPADQFLTPDWKKLRLPTWRTHLQKYMSTRTNVNDGTFPNYPIFEGRHWERGWTTVEPTSWDFLETGKCSVWGIINFLKTSEILGTSSETFGTSSGIFGCLRKSSDVFGKSLYSRDKNVTPSN